MKAVVPVTALTLLVPAFLAAGCESTQDVSARLASQSGALAEEKGLTVSGPSNPDVEVVGATVLGDVEGGAVVVELESRRDLRDVPIAIEVQDARGASVYRNDVPGLAEGLVGISALDRATPAFWVHDQVVAERPPRRATARIGRAQPAEGSTPDIEVTAPRLEEDPTSGLTAIGTVTNASQTAQRDLVVHVAARRDGEIVAAGRAVVDRLLPGRRRGYTVFFVGDPVGAELDVFAPPTTFPVRP